MSDLISRADAIEAVEHITSSMSVCVTTDECHGMKRMQRQAVIELANLPSAHPDTRKATWAIHTYMPHNYYCTNCKQDSPYNKIWDFCPHCGFKMEDYV